MTIAKDGYEYFRHRDGDLYRSKPSGLGWEIDVWGEWKIVPVPLSDQDHQHLYPVDEDEAAELRGK